MYILYNRNYENMFVYPKKKKKKWCIVYNFVFAPIATGFIFYFQFHLQISKGLVNKN